MVNYIKLYFKLFSESRAVQINETLPHFLKITFKKKIVGKFNVNKISFHKLHFHYIYIIINLNL